MNKYDSLTDEALFDLFRAGEWEAFTIIFKKYWTPLVLHANNILKDEDMAKDIVQELFSGLAGSPEKWQVKELKFYLYKAVRSRVINAIKHEKTKSNYLESLADHVSVTHADSDFQLQELIRIIDAEIQNMPPRMQEIFNLSRKQNLSHKEIADLMNISELTVRTQIRRALSTLRNNKDINTYTALLACTLAGIYK
ncbi:RNA polymerase sigma-70 factor [Pedobacter hartonius]|uniref:RNA polymerase sigma-70 factor, ECF subfamily n=1 Tax=Pedobacter hartonius TaxID=425514 RepID=A0A1H4CYJ9_9SPHI|nr:RNA polymerase sigma-70 factor [Pedobacter hartonius]SEA65504.1 RNA polymerase sigma-70 factor, ECF subfamily [Pedobacter hartonius]